MRGPEADYASECTVQKNRKPISVSTVFAKDLNELAIGERERDGGLDP